MKTRRHPSNKPRKRKRRTRRKDEAAPTPLPPPGDDGIPRRTFLQITAAAAGAAVLGPTACTGKMGIRGLDGDVQEGPDLPPDDGAVEAEGPADVPGDPDADADVPPDEQDVTAEDAPTDADDAPEELPDISLHVFVARNGTPVENVQNVIRLAGGIERFVGPGDAVVLKPNGQWPLQGYTNTECLKALIDVILARPGGFGGEVIIAEHVHRSPDEAMTGDYCWNISAGWNRTNNWPDMSYLELVDAYHAGGTLNVTAVPLYDQSADPDNWQVVAGPGELEAGKHGWVRSTYTTEANGNTVRLSYPILRSAFSGRLIDLRGGVWDGGAYTGDRVRIIFLPTLNNHNGFNSEDYAGPTSAVKCHLGIVEFAGDEGVSLHDIGYGANDPLAAGEAIGHLITRVITPTFYMTCAEYTGYRGRTDSEAAHTRTVGLSLDPVTLDFWMCKYVMYPCATSQEFMNPDNDNNLRRQLIGCNGRGVGTLDEAAITVHETG